MTTKFFNAKKMLMSTVAAVVFSFVFTFSPFCRSGYRLSTTSGNRQKNCQHFQENSHIVPLYHCTIWIFEYRFCTLRGE